VGEGLGFNNIVEEESEPDFLKSVMSAGVSKSAPYQLNGTGIVTGTSAGIPTLWMGKLTSFSLED
jgi:hypothetical protein